MCSTRCPHRHKLRQQCYLLYIWLPHTVTFNPYLYVEDSWNCTFMSFLLQHRVFYDTVVVFSVESYCRVLLKMYSLFRFKSHRSKFKNFINEKVKKWFYFFTCILPGYVPHESSKEFLKNINLKNKSWFPSEVSRVTSANNPWDDAFSCIT